MSCPWPPWIKIHLKHNIYNNKYTLYYNTIHFHTRHSSGPLEEEHILHAGQFSIHLPQCNEVHYWYHPVPPQWLCSKYVRVIKHCSPLCCSFPSVHGERRREMELLDSIYAHLKEINISNLWVAAWHCLSRDNSIYLIGTGHSTDLPTTDWSRALRKKHWQTENTNNIISETADKSWGIVTWQSHRIYLHITYPRVRKPPCRWYHSYFPQQQTHAPKHCSLQSHLSWSFPDVITISLQTQPATLKVTVLLTSSLMIIFKSKLFLSLRMADCWTLFSPSPRTLTHPKAVPVSALLTTGADHSTTQWNRSAASSTATSRVPWPRLGPATPTTLPPHHSSPPRTSCTMRGLVWGTLHSMLSLDWIWGIDSVSMSTWDWQISLGTLATCHHLSWWWTWLRPLLGESGMLWEMKWWMKGVASILFRGVWAWPPPYLTTGEW